MGLYYRFSSDHLPPPKETEIKAHLIAYCYGITLDSVTFYKLTLILGIYPINTLMTRQNSKC